MARKRMYVTEKTAFIRWALSFALAIGFGLSLARYSHAYTVVTVSTSAPHGLENAFIASTTAQWLGTVSVNPFFQNTQSVLLSGPNPAYNPPVMQTDLLNALVTVDSYSFVNGWADGANYEQYFHVEKVVSYEVNCSSPSFFAVPKIDSTTCYAVLGALGNDIYTEHLSSPMPIPGDFQ